MTKIDQSPINKAGGPIQAAWSARWLLLQWVRRDFIVQYRQSMLGTAWAIMQPILLFVVYGIVFSQVLGVRVAHSSYFVFALSGLAPWLFISTVLSRSAVSLVSSSSMLKQVYFPRAVIPLADAGVSAIDLLLVTSFLLVSQVVATGSLPITAISLVPIDLGLLLIMSGVAIFVSLFGALVRDIRFLLPTVIQVGFVLTPIMYPPSSIPARYSWLYSINPVAQFVAATRNAVLYGQWPTSIELTAPILAGAIVLAGAIWYCSAIEDRLVDVL